MKKYISLLVLIFSISSQAQEYRKIVPFQHQNKWGVVDSLANEIEAPNYESLKLFNDFTYAEFDGKDLFNLKTGEKFKSPGKYIINININNEDYYLFTNEKNSVLINFETNDTIELSEKYIYAREVQLHNINGDKTNSLLKLYLDNNKFKLFKNGNALTPLTNLTYGSSNLELIEKDMHPVGLAIKNNGYYTFYNDTYKMIKKVKVQPNKNGNYEFLDEVVVKQLSTIYKAKVNTPVLTIQSSWGGYWDLNLYKLEPTEVNNYYLDKIGYSSYIKNKNNESIKIAVNTESYSYKNPYKMIIIGKTKSSFFFDSRYMNLSRILFPEKYLKQE
ncbi:hypothetical protein M4I21_01700 [Cellulophaga sp. 20_2_10]|uniref:hypothetical protein n=1 Tax=Cellulophaga sp. 20_2_10 TaxID=2942476 RepID=UPI00201B30C7|nr:hypothetical protein [Cellulophaga sp. 20_2_10]MCL5244502.1 hypothetical protein [Cellulophaga sp. 20_2_10]